MAHLASPPIDPQLAPLAPPAVPPHIVGPQPLARPALPAGYRFVSDKQSVLARLADVHAELMRPEIYWGRDRETLQDLTTQVECSWRVVLVLKGGEGSQGELAGFCRVVGDGWDFGYLADVITVHRGKGLALPLVYEAVYNSSTNPRKSSDQWKWALLTKDAHWLYEKLGFSTGTGMFRWPTGFVMP